jgi:hypothetical protein
MREGDLLPKVALAAIGCGLAGYFAFNLYSQPLADYERIEPVRTFLREALAGNTAALASKADAQPIQWVSRAIRLGIPPRYASGPPSGRVETVELAFRTGTL